MNGKTLFSRLKDKRFSPKHVVEVGVYLPETSNVYEFIDTGVRCTLVEPDPETGDKIKTHFAGKRNVTLHAVAVHDRRGTLDLVRRGASTYAANIDKSPAVVNDGYRLQSSDCFTVDAVTFDQIDDRTVDLLSVDVEGGEWFVLKHMLSRPAVICIETHGLAYTNPWISEIRTWMRQNGYRLWYKDDSDSVYARKSVFTVTPFERFRLLVTNVRLFLKRLKKRTSRRLRYGKA
jgi:FkbM family methyltransferase